MGTEMDVHGELFVTIERGEDLKNRENLGLGVLGRGIAKVTGMKIDAYCNIKLAGVKIGSTSTKNEDLNPEYNESFHFYVCHKNVEGIVFEVKDKNTAGSTHLGECCVSFDYLLSLEGYEFKGPLSIVLGKGKPQGKLYVSVKFVPNSVADTSSPEVPSVYFTARPGNKLSFYSCAHSAPEMVPPVEMAPGVMYKVNSCWGDIFRAIESAQKFVFVTGWSFHPLIRLIRDQDDPESETTLGELLKNASERGCKVCMLVWDDRSSMSIPGLAMLSKGVMNTHDEVTRTWFAQNAPKVRCELVGRSGGEGNSIFEGQTAASFFSHHQKTVMCDCEAPDGSDERSVVAFLGGVDLTKGRYDTPTHPLYPPDDRFEDDYRQPSYDCENGQKPKQPWQDIHCRIEGPAAADVVKNFTERWLKQARNQQIDPVEELGCAYVPSSSSDAFSAQILRSIDARSGVLIPNRKLFTKKGRLVDDSIYRGYIHHIRRAERYIYIENQFFAGSCFMWSESKECGCSHTIIAELVAKIEKKIEDGEDFCVYVVQPLFPEGDPYADTVKAILKFQRLTAEAMYKAIDEALAKYGNDRNPEDYLQFHFLGKRVGGSMEGTSEGGRGSGVLAHRHRRFMVYVHSKLMIVDDDVALVGSANINMRSLAGTRDTEIAATLWQPAHMRELGPGSSVALPRGEVHGFRMSLWKEHLGSISEEDDIILRDPGSLSCSRLVQRMSQENWDQFINPDANVDTAHLMAYPLRVNKEGGFSLEAIVDDIPDFPGASMAGGDTKLPFVLTT